MSRVSGPSSDPARLEVPIDEALRLLEQGAMLIDIRQPWERGEGCPAGSQPLCSEELVSRIPAMGVPDDRPLLLLCAAGIRSRDLAARLRELGWPQAASVRGGFQAWRTAGLPVETGELDAETARYARHLALPEVGEAGQKRLSDSRVLLVGAGGLGSPAALYLAAAGVGNLCIIDDDRVDRSNLQRQIIHSDPGVGELKVNSAAERMRRLNPQINVQALADRLDKGNVDELVAAHQLVIDGSDNFDTRYLINDACLRRRRPMVYGAVLRFVGQVAVFAAGDGQAPCYRCLFPRQASGEDAPNCAEAGVLGVLPGVIGTLQATEAIKLILGIGRPLISRLLRFDALAGTFSETRLVRDPDCRWCRGS